MTKSDIIQYLKAHKAEFSQKYGIISIGLFGSYARGDNHLKSDIDLAITIKEDYKTLSNYMSLKRILEKAFQTKVDLGIEDTIKQIVRDKILNEIIYV